jgi:hypothetical protein
MTDIETVILRFIQNRSGLGAPGDYQFEDLCIDSDEKRSDGARTIRFRYWFDQDGFSQYDKTIGFEGCVTLDVDLTMRASHLEVTHIGVAAQYEPPADLIGK